MMAIPIYDKLKAGGPFFVAEAADVAASGEESVADALARLEARPQLVAITPEQEAEQDYGGAREGDIVIVVEAVDE